MKPIPFKGQTIELQPNPNQLEIDGLEVGTLPIYTDGEQCVSCWKMTFTERLKALWFGNVWIFIHSGRTQPPVAVSVERDIFVESQRPGALT